MFILNVPLQNSPYSIPLHIFLECMFCYEYRNVINLQENTAVLVRGFFRKVRFFADFIYTAFLEAIL
jgi:hypothetical protein